MSTIVATALVSVLLSFSTLCLIALIRDGEIDAEGFRIAVFLSAFLTAFCVVCAVLGQAIARLQ